ncbi:pilus assembly protein [Isoptericola croceus]|uniref:pilus assembly protein n=1 Tax=Isoptericola croceus TaxID=3031406 RepID=UPI0023F87537|nr:pilus assembly protein [Isoptericola croceus]
MRRITRPASVHDDVRERGAISTWVAMTTVAMMLFVGIAVDFGGQVFALQHVRDVAAQAARTGGQQINASQAMRGQDASVEAAQARAAANAYLRAADVDGNAEVFDGTRLVVTVSDRYDTKVLSIIGVKSLPVTGTSEARLARVVGGIEQ